VVSFIEIRIPPERWVARAWSVCGFYLRPVGHQSSSHPMTASGLHLQGVPAHPQPSWPIGLSGCTSQTQPVAPHLGHGVVRAWYSFALGAGGFFIMRVI